jgi:hypothetical protein
MTTEKQAMRIALDSNKIALKLRYELLSMKDLFE